MAVTGRTGADAIFQAMRHICHVISAYNLKLRAVITAAQSAGAITSAQATTITNFIDTASVTCAALQALSDYSGF